MDKSDQPWTNVSMLGQMWPCLDKCDQPYGYTGMKSTELWQIRPAPDKSDQPWTNQTSPGQIRPAPDKCDQAIIPWFERFLYFFITFQIPSYYYFSYQFNDRQYLWNSVRILYTFRCDTVNLELIIDILIASIVLDLFSCFSISFNNGGL